MLELIISRLLTVVKGLDYFERIIPLVEQKSDGEKTMPHEYLGKGQYSPISNFDNYNGVAYLRRTGNIDSNRSGEKPIAACIQLIDFSYPLRLVAAIKRELLPKDCAFSDDIFAIEIAGKLVGQNGKLKSDLGATTVEINPSKILFDRSQILNEEYPGRKITDIDYKMSYIAIDLQVKVTINKNCIKTICDQQY